MGKANRKGPLGLSLGHNRGIYTRLGFPVLEDEAFK